MNLNLAKKEIASFHRNNKEIREYSDEQKKYNNPTYTNNIYGKSMIKTKVNNNYDRLLILKDISNIEFHLNNIKNFYII